MFRRFAHALVIVALIAATGSHWAVLQAVAWSTMLADNLRTSSLTEAVQRTFDGRHPCSLCKKISSGKESEKKAEFPVQLKKLEFISVRPVIVLSPPRHFRLLPEFQCSASEPAHKPSVPPPRCVFA
jgi:hypothetical protein